VNNGIDIEKEYDREHGLCVNGGRGKRNNKGRLLDSGGLGGASGGRRNGNLN
jgi:hypothetical protein